MLEVLHSQDLWKRIALVRRGVKGATTAAVAYANRDHLSLRAGDTLICDASPHRIETGATTHALLSTLARKRVKLFHLPGLHAKVVRLPRHVAIGSANMTTNSMSLHEVVVLTDDDSAISQTDLLLEKLLANDRLQVIDSKFLKAIATIKVMPGGGGGRLSRREEQHPVTWLMGYKELSAREQAKSAASLEGANEVNLDLPYFRMPIGTAAKRPRIQCGDSLMLAHLKKLRVSRPVEVVGVVDLGAYRYHFHKELAPGDVDWLRVSEKLRVLAVRNRPQIPAQLELDATTAATLLALFRKRKVKTKT